MKSFFYVYLMAISVSLSSFTVLSSAQAGPVEGGTKGEDARKTKIAEARKLIKEARATKTTNSAVNQEQSPYAGNARKLKIQK